MSRKERRAAEHVQRKADRTAGFPTTPPVATPKIPISPDRLAAGGPEYDRLRAEFHARYALQQKGAAA
jgi:hypothetical protein